MWISNGKVRVNLDRVKGYYPTSETGYGISFILYQPFSSEDIYDGGEVGFQFRGDKEKRDKCLKKIDNLLSVNFIDAEK